MTDPIQSNDPRCICTVVATLGGNCPVHPYGTIGPFTRIATTLPKHDAPVSQAEMQGMRDMITRMQDQLDAIHEGESDDEDDAEDEDHDASDRQCCIASAMELRELRREVFDLKNQLAGARSVADHERTQRSLFEKDYRMKAAELHALQDPTKRAGQEAKLLLQLGQVQAELFQTQAELRESSHQRELLTQSVRPEDMAERFKRHKLALDAYQKDIQKLEESLPPGGARILPAGPKDPTYYEQLCDDLDIDPGKKR